MKRIRSFGLGVFIAVVFMITVVTTEVDAAPLYVKSTDVPTETTTLAKQYWQEYLNRMMVIESGNSSDYYLGHPFTISYPENTTLTIQLLVPKTNKLPTCCKLIPLIAKIPIVLFCQRLWQRNLKN
jgi:hypothetical protein